MSDVFVFEETIGEDGKLVLHMPPEAPHGRVRVTVESVGENTEELTPEEEAALDAEIEMLIRKNGEGLTMGEIAHAPEIGAWAHRTDIGDSVDYIDRMRREKRERRMRRD